MNGSGHLTPGEISGYLDGEIELEADQSRHLKSCPECSEALAGQRRLRRMARAAKPEVPTERMWRAIQGRLGEEPAPQRRFWRDFLRSPRWLVASTSGTIVAGLLAIAVVRQTGEMPGEAVPPPAPTAAEESGDGMAYERPPAPERARPAREEAADADAPRPAGKELRRAAKRTLAPASAPRQPDRSASGGGPAVLSGAPEPSAAMGAAEPPARPSYRGARFILEADEIDYPGAEAATASGRVEVRPARPGTGYFAVVDGFSRTLTGVQEGVSAEIRQPGERLILRTK